MSLIDITYFDNNDINIPYNTRTQTVLDGYITRYEKEILILILGYDLYKLVYAYANPGSDQRIIDIVEGKEYAYDDDHTVYWEGLINTTTKVSPIAYYVYCQYLRHHDSLLLPAGNVKPDVENSQLFTSSYKLTHAWGEMLRLFGFPGQNPLIGSLYNFLMKYESTYPEWEYTFPGRINIMDI